MLLLNAREAAKTTIKSFILSSFRRPPKTGLSYGFAPLFGTLQKDELLTQKKKLIDGTEEPQGSSPSGSH